MSEMIISMLCCFGGIASAFALLIVAGLIRKAGSRNRTYS